MEIGAEVMSRAFTISTYHLSSMEECADFLFALMRLKGVVILGGQGVLEKKTTILFLDSYLTRLMTDFLDNIKKGQCELFLPFICYESHPFSIQ